MNRHKHSEAEAANLSAPTDDVLVQGASLTLSDTADLATPAVRFQVGVSGNVKVTTLAGNERVIACVAGFEYRVIVKRFWATGTTATGIVAYV